MNTLVRHAPYCTEPDQNGDHICNSAAREIPGIGWVWLSHCEEGTVLHIEDPKRGFHEFDTRGQYDIDEAKAIIAAMSEAVLIAESNAMSASAPATCTGVREC